MRSIQNRWFVSFETPSQWRHTSGRAPSSRKTKAFQTEIEAKQYAKVMLSKLLKVTAGTLNPHLPRRRIIETSEIEQWIAEAE
jgi:hypothetical protein